MQVLICGLKSTLSFRLHVQFVIHQGDYTSIQEWIKTGAIDFGFISPYAVADIQTIKLKEGAMLAVLPQNHPLAEMECIPLSKLSKEPFILLEEGHYYEPFASKRFIEYLQSCVEQFP